MDPKHYKKYIRQLLDAGISKTKIAKECGITEPTIYTILKGDGVSETTKQKICEGYDKIVSRFISLEQKDGGKDGTKKEM